MAFVYAVTLHFRSETTPTMWISRFFRAVENAHRALSAIEEERKTVDVAALERDLARRRQLLRQVEELRDRHALAAIQASRKGVSVNDSDLQANVRVHVAIVSLSFSDSQSEKTDTDSRSPSWNMTVVLLRFQILKEGELWKEIHKLSNAVKTQVSLHLNAWRQQLAYFIDTRYLRLEQYERQEMLNLERLRANPSRTQTLHDTDRYMTREQKALSFREKSKEVGLNCFRYFSFRWRVGHLLLFLSSGTVQAQIAFVQVHAKPNCV